MYYYYCYYYYYYILYVIFITNILYFLAADIPQIVPLYQHYMD